MSSSSVCQGLQSCLEPFLMEAPRVLRLKLAPPKSNFSPSTAEENNTPTITENTIHKTVSHDCDMKSPQVGDLNGWSFLHYVNSSSHKTSEKDRVYVHPLVKRSSSKLSKKSLEMCTESLGSETGSQVSQSSDEISLISPETEILKAKEPAKLPQNSVTKRANRSSFNFPPPLPSISGSTGVQVRPHREGGRLVLQAVPVTSSHTYFHAERSGGRLRLCLMRDPSPTMNKAEEEGQDKEEIEEEEEEYVEEEFDGEEEEDDDDEVEDEAYQSDDIEGNNGKVRGQMGVDKLQRPGRCKEGGHENKGLLIWKPFWVAT